jgi:hypothetical protein
MNIHLLYDNNYSQWFVESIEAFFPENKDRFIVYNPSDSNNEKSLYVKHIRCESLPILKKGQAKLQEQISFDGVKNLIIHFYDEGLGRHIREIPSNVKVKWIVWGADMFVPISKYANGQLDCFSSQHYMSLNLSAYFGKGIRPILSRVKEWFLLHFKPYQEKIFQERKLDIERVDEIFTYLDGDYEQIISNYAIKKHIPFRLFAYQYVGKHIAIEEKKTIEGALIQVGHNATPFNNQFEVLEKLANFAQKFDILLPISYGDTLFAEKLMQKTLPFKNLNIIAIEKMLPYTEYQQLIGNAKIHIFNNWRQEAMGNILQCIAAGKKVYLSEKNTGFDFLNKIGCSIFSINADILSLDNNTSLTDDLSESEKEKNQQAIIDFFSTEQYKNRLQALLS